MRLWDQGGQHVGVVSSLEALGALAADEGRAEHAVRLFAAADVFREKIDCLTNAEIGQRLFISPRTAKAHLAHIFAKLGITPRRQLPRLKATQEPQPAPR